MTTFTLPRFDQPQSRNPVGGFGALQSSVGNLPLRQLGYETRVVGVVVNTTITQTYYNPFDEVIEATYIFPIEGNQAVTGCEMWVADRIVRAKLKERGQARSDYRRAITQGYRAALLEENRSETFSMKVGNIPPGEAVRIKIQTVGQLPVVRGEWTLRLPLVVAPRYTSGFPLPGRSVGPGVTADTDGVPDASMVTPPTRLPGFASPVDLSLSVELELGDLVSDSDWARQIRSSLHAVLLDSASADESNGRSCRVRVFPGEKVNRDFILRGEIDAENIATSLTLEPPVQNRSEDRLADTTGTFAINIVPPVCDAETPRDVVFLLDRSGSMGGWKMTAARRGISRLIDKLSPLDRFQVIAFDDRVSTPFDKSVRGNRAWVEATDANRYQAVKWLAKIDSRGGTEMGLAIEQALQVFRQTDPHDEDNHRSRAMVLVTDGQITGEDAVLRLLGTISDAQRPRLYCLGVDRAVNASVLQRITNFTGGTFELVESEKRLDEVMGKFADELGAPAITNLKVQVVGDDHATATVAPSWQRDLYHGRCCSIYGRARVDRAVQLRLEGRLASGDRWTKELSASPRTEATQIPSLLPMWGRARIRELEDTFVAGGNADLQLQAEILNCSLACNVLSRFTAFVAVDESEKVTDRKRPHQMTQPVEHPEGWQPIVPRLTESDLIPVPGSYPATQPMRVKGSKLPQQVADLMLQRGIVSPEQLAEAEMYTRDAGGTLGDALVMLQYATSDQVSRVVAEVSRLPFIDLRQVRIPDEVIERIPESVARENSVLPYSFAGGELTVLISDPNDLETIEKLRFILNIKIRTMVSPRESIQGAINQYYGQIEGESADSMLQEFTDTAIDFTESESDDDLGIDMATGDQVLSTLDAGVQSMGFDDDDVCMEVPQEDVGRGSRQPLRKAITARRSRDSSEGPATRRGIHDGLRGQTSVPAAQPTDSPVIRLVNLILAEAVQLKASHILLKPGDEGIQIAYVIDGVAVERETAPRRMLSAIAGRLKILAKLDLSVRDRLQSGELGIVVGATHVDVVIHFAPTPSGPTVLIDFTSQSAGQPVDLEQEPEPVRAWWEHRLAGQAGSAS